MLGFSRFGKNGVKAVHYWLKRLSPDRPVRVFLSHNHQDREYVESQIREPLASRNVETWYADQDIISGDDYIRCIQDGLLKCDWVRAVLTAHAVASDWVRAEVNTALTDPRFRGRVVPVRVDDTAPAQFATNFGPLDVLDVSDSPSPSEVIYNFLVKRERELRAFAKIAPEAARACRWRDALHAVTDEHSRSSSAPTLRAGPSTADIPKTYPVPHRKVIDRGEAITRHLD